MRIVHFAPFAPGRCGLYETTRDIIAAEKRLGHEAELVDTGVEGKRHVGATDRGITTVSKDVAASADVVVTHTDVREAWLPPGAPVVHILHGRPESTFRLSQEGKGIYDLYARWVREGKVDRWVTLWRAHRAYWRALIPNSQLSATSAPPCDLDLYSTEGERHEFTPAGTFNVLIGDMWRPDSDPFHILHGLLSVDVPGLRVHVYAARNPLGPWAHVFRALRQKGILGEVKGVMHNFDRVLRAADLVVSPHRIATRLQREALAVGTPVIGGTGSRFATYVCDTQDPGSVAWTVTQALTADSMRPVDARPFALAKIGQELIDIYQSVRSPAWQPA